MTTCHYNHSLNAGPLVRYTGSTGSCENKKRKWLFFFTVDALLAALWAGVIAAVCVPAGEEPLEASVSGGLKRTNKVVIRIKPKVKPSCRNQSSQADL